MDNDLIQTRGDVKCSASQIITIKPFRPFGPNCNYVLLYDFM